jgi:hypothetical protein
VDSVGFGLSFGLQTQSSVRHMLVSTEDLRFWRPGGKVLVLGPAHWLGLRVTVVCMCEGSAITISLLWLCYFFFLKKWYSVLKNNINIIFNCGDQFGLGYLANLLPPSSEERGTKPKPQNRMKNRTYRQATKHPMEPWYPNLYGGLSLKTKTQSKTD